MADLVSVPISKLNESLSLSFENLQRAQQGLLLFNRMLLSALESARSVDAVRESGALEEFTGTALATLLSPIESDLDAGLSACRIALRLVQPAQPALNVS